MHERRRARLAFMATSQHVVVVVSQTRKEIRRLEIMKRENKKEIFFRRSWLLSAPSLGEYYAPGFCRLSILGARGDGEDEERNGER